MKRVPRAARPPVRYAPCIYDLRDRDITFDIPVRLLSHLVEHYAMARWPDNPRATITTVLLITVVFPLLCWLAVWFVGS